MPRRHRNPFTKHLRIIRLSLTAIERSVGRLVALTNGGASAAAAGRAPQKRKLKLSPKRRTELKLQGQYMGYLRNLRPRQKAQVKALREKKGIRVATAMAKRIATG